MSLIQPQSLIYEAPTRAPLQVPVEELGIW